MSQPVNPTVKAYLDRILAACNKTAEKDATIVSLTATMAQVRDDAAATHSALAQAAQDRDLNAVARDKALADLATVTADRDATEAALKELDASLAPPTA